jgi:hypothetical protein
VLLLHNECLNETLFVSLPQARSVLDAWRADYNEVRPHSALANRTPEEFRAQHIAVAAAPATVKTSTQDSTPDWMEAGAQVSRNTATLRMPTPAAINTARRCLRVIGEDRCRAAPTQP